MSHSDCATYGGLAQFKGDRRAEAEAPSRRTDRAAQLLRKFSEISVEPYFVNFDGVWEISRTRARKDVVRAGEQVA